MNSLYIGLTTLSCKECLITLITWEFPHNYGRAYVSLILAYYLFYNHKFCNYSLLSLNARILCAC